jgi:predicted nucleotidyltransferase
MIFYKNLKNSGLSRDTIDIICYVFSANPNIHRAWLYGSRSKGTAEINSDIDLALEGDLSFSQLSSIHGQLEELPLPYCFDVIDKRKIIDTNFIEHLNKYSKLIYSTSEDFTL